MNKYLITYELHNGKRVTVKVLAADKNTAADYIQRTTIDFKEIVSIEGDEE